MIPTLVLALLAGGDEADGRQAAAWDRFRGPNGTGVAADDADYPERLDPASTMLWRTPLPAGQSSPILSRDGVFLTSFDGQELQVVAVEREDGAPRWRHSVEREREGLLDQRNGPASPSPAVDRESVVVFFQDVGLLGYDHAGNERWRLPLGPFDNIYGMGASPVLVEGTAYLVCDQATGSFAIAVDALSGEQLWHAERPQARSGHATPVLWRGSDGDPQLVVAGSFLLESYGLASGERRWWSRGLCFEMKSVPVVHGDVLFVAGYGSPFNQPGTHLKLPDFTAVLLERDADEDGALAPDEVPEDVAGWFSFVDLDQDGALDEQDWDYLRAALASRNGLLALRAGGEGDRTEGALAWAWRRAVPQLPSPLLYEGVLFVLADSGGILMTLDPDSGEQTGRGRLSAAIDDYYASPVAGGGHVYFLSRDGIASVLPSGGGFEPLSTTELGEGVDATPALAGGRVYLRTNEALYCFAEREH